MCRNFDQMVREWKEEGKSEGIAEGRNLGIAEGRNLGIAEGRRLGITEGKGLGVSEGRVLGIQQEKENVIQRLNKIGLPIEQIAMAVALSTTEVQSLIAG